MAEKDANLCSTYRTANTSFLARQTKQTEEQAQELSKVHLPSNDEKLNYYNNTDY